MEDTSNLLESLLERATDYGKTGYELFKLKTIDKTTDLVTSFIPRSVVFVFILSFFLFLNLGLAFLFGNMLNSIGLGFILVAAFYGVSGIIVHYLLHQRIKRAIRNYINKQLVKQKYI